MATVSVAASEKLQQAEELAGRYPNTIAVMLNISQGGEEGRLDQLVRDHHLVIR